MLSPPTPHSPGGAPLAASVADHRRPPCSGTAQPAAGQRMPTSRASTRASSPSPALPGAIALHQLGRRAPVRHPHRSPRGAPAMTSSSTPLVRSGGQPRLPCRHGPAGTHPLSAKSASSIRPTVVSRSRTVVATSSAYPRLASWRPASSERTVTATVSRRGRGCAACSQMASQGVEPARDVTDGSVRAVIGHHSDPELSLILLDLVGDIGESRSGRRCSFSLPCPAAHPRR